MIPTFIKPMLFKENKTLEYSSDWICQDKKDGCRAIIHIKNGEVFVQGRKNWSTIRYPEMQKAFSNELNCILDGELITQDDIFNHSQIREQNNKPFKVQMVAKMYPVKFMVFDILEKDGKDLRSLTLVERLKILNDTITKNTEYVEVLPIYTDIKDRFKWAEVNKKEGVVVKRLDSRYIDDKRVDFWIKLKCWKYAEVEFTTYENNNAGITLENANGTRVLVAGASASQVRTAIDTMQKVKIKIQYLNMTKNGCYRMPTFQGIVK